MKINDITKISHRHFSSDNTSKKSKYLRNLISRILLSIIFVISTLIYIKIDDRNLLYVEDYIFTDSLKFTKINNWYQNHIGKVLPNTNNSVMVFENDDILKSNYDKYLDGVKLEYNKGNPVSILYGGIVVFIGEKEGYQNTVIIQGNNGIDYWYGNITNVNVNLYDYLEKDTLIGEANDNYIYIVLEKEGKYLNYEEYLKKN